MIGAHVKEGYVGSTDLLTRAAPSSDFATDTCIRRDGIDPATNTRYLQELAFEVVNEQSMRDITDQAEDLTALAVASWGWGGVSLGEGLRNVCVEKGPLWGRNSPISRYHGRRNAESAPARERRDARNDCPGRTWLAATGLEEGLDAGGGGVLLSEGPLTTR